MKLMSRFSSGVLLLVLAGCGDGGGGNSPGSPPVPALRSGEIDASYGTGGYVQLAASEGFREMAAGQDGSVYVTGNSILKLGPSGNLALDYGQAGRVAISAASPVVDGGGSLYVISGMEVVRLDPSGRLDASFGNAGRVVLGGITPHVRLDKITRDPQGNLFVAGVTGGASQTVVTKVGTDGRIDQSFGTSGSSVPPEPSFSGVESVVVDEDLNVSIAGMLLYAAAGAPARPRIIKIDRNGALVAGFGTAGVWSPEFVCSSTFVRALAPMPGGDLVWGGSCLVPNLSLFRATTQKLDRGGSKVTSFREGGFELFGPTTPGGLVVESQWVNALQRNTGGNLYAGGYRRGGLICAQGAVAKFDANGQPVAEFGSGGGYVALDGINDVRSIGLDAAGRLYLGGTHFTACNDTERPFVVYRLGG